MQSPPPWPPGRWAGCIFHPGLQELHVSWLLVAGSTTPRALLRHASVQQVLDAAGDGVVVVEVGGLVAGAEGLAVQAPPHAMGKGQHPWCPGSLITPSW